MFPFDLHFIIPDFAKVLLFFTSFLSNSYFFDLFCPYTSFAFDFGFDFEKIIDELEVLEINELPSPTYFFLGLDRDT